MNFNFEKSLYFNSLQKRKKKNHEWKIRVENHSLFQKKLYEKKIKGLLLINKLWILILRNDSKIILYLRRNSTSTRIFTKT